MTMQNIWGICERIKTKLLVVKPKTNIQRTMYKQTKSECNTEKQQSHSSPQHQEDTTHTRVHAKCKHTRMQAHAHGVMSF